MNPISLTVTAISIYNVMVRETLEYAIPKQAYDLKAYNAKKEHIIGQLKGPSSLKNFIDNNKEKTVKLVEMINTLIDTIYSDNSTVCRVANNELRVDASQHLAVYDCVIELHEAIKSVIDGNLGFAKSKGMLEDKILKLALADDKLYRTIALKCLYHDLESLFYEYNKARNEAKGALTPQSNFIQGELTRVVKHIMFVKDHQSATDNKYWEMVDYVLKTVDWTSGKRALPEGKKFGDCFKEGREILADHLKTYMEEWHPIYLECCNELNDAIIKSNPEAAKAAAAAKAAEATKTTEPEQKVEEKKDTTKLN